MCPRGSAGAAPSKKLRSSAEKSGILGSSAILATTATLDADALVGSVGSAALRPYVADKGFEGEETHQRWLQSHGVRTVCPLKGNGRKGRWPKRLGRWAVSIRQINRDRLRKATQHFRTLSAFAESALKTWRGCGLVWRRGWRCTASAAGSTNYSAVLGWLSLICWIGDLDPSEAFKSQKGLITRRAGCIDREIVLPSLWWALISALIPTRSAQCRTTVQSAHPRYIEDAYTCKLQSQKRPGWSLLRPARSCEPDLPIQLIG